MGEFRALRLQMIAASVARLALVFALLAGGSALALAQGNPFGMGPPAASPPPPAGGLIAWLLTQQAQFHRELTAAMGAVAASPAALATLVGLAFSYGVLHAVGPGHGKAVIASYLVANETALRRGITLSFAAAGVQAAIAIAVVGAVAGLMGGTARDMSAVTRWVEQSGFLLIAAMGLWIGLRKARALFAPASAQPATCGPDCGHAHAADPRMLARASMRDLALTAIGAGIRPCTGAIILLVFALAKGLFMAGALAVTAMAVGTALGTSLFALIAVKAKVLALNAISGRGGGLRRLATLVEFLAGLALAALGLALFLGAWDGGG